MVNGIEHERRFLVTSMDNDVISDVRRILIEQGYFDLIDSFRSFRVRIEDGKDASVAFKSGSGSSRPEKEKRVSLGVARFFLGNSSHHLEKIRYFPPWSDRHSVMTVDVYKPPLTGIVKAEVEFEKRDASFIPPAILKPVWVSNWLEVTDTLSDLHFARLATELRAKGSARPDFAVFNRLLARRIPRIVLTGGPCSGKSAVLKTVRKEMGGQIHCIDEVATILILQAGVKPQTDAYRFNESAYRVQSIFESTSEAQAIDEGKRALLVDRGRVDIAAYTPGGWEEFSRMFGSTKENEYSQYGAVICMAVPPRDIYDSFKENNAARGENYQEAVNLEKKIIAAWGDHPNFHFIQNPSWPDKQNQAIGIIKEFLS